LANEILGCQKNGDLAPNGKHHDDDDNDDAMDGMDGMGFPHNFLMLVGVSKDEGLLAI
jgi:hypothetical protein